MSLYDRVYINVCSGRMRHIDIYIQQEQVLMLQHGSNRCHVQNPKITSLFREQFNQGTWTTIDLARTQIKPSIGHHFFPLAVSQAQRKQLSEQSPIT